MSEKIKNPLPIIPYGHTPNILLLGNGIGRAFKQYSWDDLLNDMAIRTLNEEEKAEFEKLPYPLKPVVLTKDTINDKINEFAEKLINIQMHNEQLNLIGEFVDIGFDAILTTNYTYEIEKSIDSTFDCKINKRSKYRKSVVSGNATDEQYGLFKYMEVGTSENKNRIWHIHGEAARPSSVVLGHYYYGKLTSKIQQYVYTVKKRYEGCKMHKTDFMPYSWIDYFLIGNVHIAGFGLDLSEFDIWWLINCKKRNPSMGGNIYYYEPNMDKKENTNKRMLAETYGINIISKTLDRDYIEYYRNVIDEIKGRM